MKQYIDLYNSQRENVDIHSARALNLLRPKAFEAILNSQLPRLGEENYEITDLNGMFEPDYGININRLNMEASPAEAFKCDVPNMTTWLYFLFNDTFHKGNNSTSIPENVIVASLKDAAEQYPELVEKYYGKLAPIADPQVALNTLFAQDGVFIFIPKNTILERPIQLVNILNSGVPLMANRRILIVAEENSQARILTCDHTQNVNQSYLNNQVIELFVEKGAYLDLYDIEESSETTNRVSSLFVRQEQGSNLLVDGITLLNGKTRNNYIINVDGENAETQLLGMAISNDSQHIDNHTYISHNAPRCKSNELFKYLLDDEARGAFTGKILVRPGADKIEAYQSNKNIVASPLAKMHTKPQLEIYTDDVKCSHGATIGQLDQKALFYMQTRGISLEEAKMLLMQAFMNDVIAGVRMDALKDRLHHLVEKRFYGKLALCGDCSGTCHGIGK